MRYYIIAGEASGDLHGSNLMRGLKESDPQSDFRFWGGDMMAEVGGCMVKHYKEGAVMGFVEVLSHLGRILDNISFCKKDLLEYHPDVLILIDYPGFNLKIAKFAKKRGITVFYYIAPKVWAWKESRVKLLKRYIDKLFIIFPFEIEYFKRKGIETVYCGNPLIDKISSDRSNFESKEEFYSRHHLENKPSIALLAGSRKMEIDFLLPIMKKITRSFGDKYQFLLAVAPSIEIEYYGADLSQYNIIPIVDDTYSVLKHSQAAIISSGTASLEAALIGTPQVVCYGANPLSFLIAKLVVKLPAISLGNLIIGKTAFKELLQSNCNAANLSKELDLLLNDLEYIKGIKQDYSAMRSALGKGGASLRIANKMVHLLKEKNGN